MSADFWRYIFPVGAGIAAFRVAPDVWAKLLETVPEAPTQPVYGWRVYVDPYLPDGCVVPLDSDGNVMLKPRSPESDDDVMAPLRKVTTGEVE